MAKRALRTPRVPPGRRMDFFRHLQLMLCDHGDPSLAELSKKLHVSPQALHKALTGPRVPSESLAAAITRALAGEAAVAETLDLRILALKEDRGLLDDHEKAPRTREPRKNAQSSAETAEHQRTPAPQRTSNKVDSTAAEGVLTRGDSREMEYALQQQRFIDRLSELCAAAGGPQRAATLTSIGRSTLYSWLNATAVPSGSRFSTFVTQLREQKIDESAITTATNAYMDLVSIFVMS